MTERRGEESTPSWRAMLKKSQEDEARRNRRLSSALVLETIKGIHTSGRIATRPVVADVLGVAVGRLDEHVKYLLELGLLRRLNPGVYEPADVLSHSKPVSLTHLPDGRMKLDVGEVCVEMTPPECRAIASMLLGAAFDFNLLTTTRDLANQIADLRAAQGRIKDEMRQQGAPLATPRAREEHADG